MLRTDIAVTFITKIGRIVALALGTVILARALGPSGRGLYALALLLPRTISTVVQMGQSAVNGTFPGLYPDRRKSLFAQVVFLSAVSSTVGVIALVAYMFWLPWPKGRFESLSNTTVYLGVALLFAEVFANMMRDLARGCGHVKSTSLVEAGVAILQCVGFLVVLVVFGGDVSSALVVTIISALILLAFCTLRVREYASLNPKRLSWSLLKESLAFGAVITLSTTAIFLVSQISLYIMNYMNISLADIGIFAVAVNLASELGVIPDSVARAYLPRLSNDLSARAQQTPKVYRLTLLACCIMSLGVIAASPFLLRLLYGPDFSGAIVPFLLLVPGVLFFGSTRVLGIYFWAKKKPQYGLISNWTALVVTTLVCIIFVRFYGILGAAVGKASGQIVLGAMTIFWFHKESGTPLKELIIKAEDIRSFGIMMASMVTRRKRTPTTTTECSPTNSGAANKELDSPVQQIQRASIAP